MGQGQSWGTVTVSARLAKAGAQYSFSQVIFSFWDMARAGQGTAQFQSNSSSYLRGPAANFVCLVIMSISSYSYSSYNYGDDAGHCSCSIMYSGKQHADIIDCTDINDMKCGRGHTLDP